MSRRKVDYSQEVSRTANVDIKQINNSSMADTMAKELGQAMSSITSKNGVPTKNHEVFDKLMRKRIKSIDKNILSVQGLIKPKAKTLYYDRKIQLENLLIDKAKIDASNLDHILSMTKDVKDADAVIKELKNIMEKYNIKHSLRGDQ